MALALHSLEMTVLLLSRLILASSFHFQKLQKANDDLKEMASLKQGEIDTLKSTCDWLSAGTTKKEAELQTMTEKVQQMELQVSWSYLLESTENFVLLIVQGQPLYLKYRASHCLF